MKYIRWFRELTAEDVAQVGGKNASLGEMMGTLSGRGIRVPDGFAVTAAAYRRFLEASELADALAPYLDDLARGVRPLAEVGASLRALVLGAPFPDPIAREIRSAYADLAALAGDARPDVAVRSSATAEDLPEASFAGQQETFLNVAGCEQLLQACRRCYASLFTDRAISYRERQRFDHLEVALSVGVQRMVRSDLGSAGVCFSLDTESGFPDVVLINAAWGLGESVVQGSVTPDEYTVFKPLLDRPGCVPIIERVLGGKEAKLVYDERPGNGTVRVATSEEERNRFVLDETEILRLARCTREIERHYGCPVDVEWARDGVSGEIFIVQARPETVQSRRPVAAMESYTLEETGTELVRGLSVGQAVAAGKACVIEDARDIDRFETGTILVTRMTDPDWVPIMERAAGIITDLGGRTCHAAIVSRELGVPAVVGTGHATRLLRTGQPLTLSCAEGDEGIVYEGILPFRVEELSLEVPETRCQIMLNIGSPAAAFRYWRLPCQGVGLARMEFIINNHIQIHPMALVHFDRLEDAGARREIERLTRGWADKVDYFVDHLARGIAKIAASRYPHPVIVRMSDFKTNEYADLVGGEAFEPVESNPMLGFRGASRYYSERYREGFALECRAIRRVREELGLTNVLIMIPFCRTLEEADRVLEVLAENGLRRGDNGLEVYVMAEIPSNVILAEEFADRFDGFSIGSNDLTQLVLGVDRDSSDLASLFDERNEAVKRVVSDLIARAHSRGRKVGICGQAPSDYPEFAAFLVAAGIDSMSLNPDSIVPVKRRVGEVEWGLRASRRQEKRSHREPRSAHAAS
ncbi:MAG: phosphoenolpyruvate synthase [Gemmatimonadota bacterium]